MTDNLIERYLTDMTEIRNTRANPDPDTNQATAELIWYHALAIG